MCKYSPSCRLNCTDALKCPQVTLAFGPDVEHPEMVRHNARGWWSRPDGCRPRARTNAQGVKLCSRDGCNAPRQKGNHLCQEHLNEYHREYYQRKKPSLLAKRRERYMQAGR